MTCAARDRSWSEQLCLRVIHWWARDL